MSVDSQSVYVLFFTPQNGRRNNWPASEQVGGGMNGIISQGLKRSREKYLLVINEATHIKICYRDTCNNNLSEMQSKNNGKHNIEFGN